MTFGYRWLIRALLAVFGAKVLKAEVTVAHWPGTDEHNPNGRYLRAYVSILVLGRFMDAEIRL